MKPVEQFCFHVVNEFLQTMHNRFGWDDLGSLLGGLWLVVDVPFDSAMAEDWDEVFSSVASSSVGSTAGHCLQKDMCYKIMIVFLAKVLECDGDIKNLLRKMEDVLHGQDVDLALTWNESVSFIIGGGSIEPYTVSKGGTVFVVDKDK